MPTQWTSGNQVFLPDGCDVQVKASGDGSYTSLGNILGDSSGVHNFDINEVEFNDGQKITQHRNETIALSFILANLNATSVQKLSGSMFSVVDTAGTPVSDIADQTISSGWSDNTVYNLVMDSTAEGEIRTTAQPTLTSVTLDPTGTPEVLVEDTEYVVVNQGGGNWGIQFISANMATGSPTTFDIVVDYGTNTPIASTKITAGKSSGEFAASAIKFVHTDDSGNTRFLEVYAATPESGSFAFSFRAIASGEVEQMPITLTGKLDATRSSGDQLFNWGYDDGAA